ncbi:putative Histidine kinase [Candidatus Terasakiella magnetica]|nr:putative Histidine kinase [Candidatus Terasakiella magnetica]
MRGFWKHGPSIVLLAMVLMALSYIGIIIANDFNVRREGVRTEIRNGLEDFVAATESYFATYEAVVSAVAETDCVRGRGAVPCGDLFFRLNGRFPHILNFAAIGRDGRFFASGQPFPASGPPDTSNLPFFTTLAKGDRGLYVMDPHRGPVSGELVTGLSIPLRNMFGAFDGLVGVSLKFQELEGIWNRVKPGSDVGIVIFDRHRSLIFSTPEAQGVARLGEAERRQLLDRLSEGEGVVTFVANSWVFRSATVAGNDWVVAALHPGPYGIANYLRDTAVLPQLLFPTVLLGLLGLLLSYREWRQMFALEALVMDRTSELMQVNADLKRSNRELGHSVAELETFAWVASHDLREPLRTISTYVTLLERRYGEQLDEDGRTFILYARSAAQRMNDLVLDLLDYVKVGSASGLITPVEVEVLARQVIDDLGDLISRTGATVRILPPLPSLFLCESDLTRLLLNLISNGIKYCHPDRLPVVTVAADLGAEGWVFRVEDNGIGIDPQYFDKIFVLFQRLNPVKETSGTGIGLTVCRKIVNRYGGRIWVESEQGQGSRFLFTLPDTVLPDTLPRA